MIIENLLKEPTAEVEEEEKKEEESIEGVDFAKY